MSYAGDVDPADAYAALRADPEAVLVDVRTSAEWTYVGLPDLSQIGKRVIPLEWQRFPDGALNERFVGRPLMRSCLLIPWSLSRIVVGLLWVGILDFEFGALNGVLHNLGLIDRSIAFFKDGWSALNVLVSVYMWNQAPFASLLFLAGMQSISEDQYSAAEVDGAGYWQRFWYVTLPALRPIVFLVLVLATVNGFLMLDLIYVLTMGGPANDTTTLSWLGFQTTFSFFKFGPGTAILYTLTALCLLLTFIYHRLILARFEPEA